MVPSEGLAGACFRPPVANEPGTDIEVVVGQRREVVRQVKQVAKLFWVGGMHRELVPQHEITIV